MMTIFFFILQLTITMATITLMRHAESEAAAQYKDILDSSLSERGKQQASELTGHYDLVICTPLCRTRETVEHSNITYSKLIVLEEAREMKMRTKYNYLKGEHTIPESKEKFVKRMERLEEMLVDLSKSYKEILVVCHAFVIRYLVKRNMEELPTDVADAVRLDKTNHKFCEIVKLELPLSN